MLPSVVPHPSGGDYFYCGTKSRMEDVLRSLPTAAQSSDLSQTWFLVNLIKDEVLCA